jgi:hypothetical protein
MPVSHNPGHLLAKPWVRNYLRGWKDVIIEPHRGDAAAVRG